MKYLYKDLLEGQACCESCDCWLKVDFGSGMFCPNQEQLVRESGYCEAYEGFWRLINDPKRRSLGKDGQDR